MRQSELLYIAARAFLTGRSFRSLRLVADSYALYAYWSAYPYWTIDPCRTSLRLVGYYLPELNCVLWSSLGVNRCYIELHDLKKIILQTKPSVYFVPIISPLPHPEVHQSFDPAYLQYAEFSSLWYIWKFLPPYYSLSCYKQSSEKYLSVFDYLAVESLVDKFLKSKIFHPETGAGVSLPFSPTEFEQRAVGVVDLDRTTPQTLVLERIIKRDDAHSILNTFRIMYTREDGLPEWVITALAFWWVTGYTSDEVIRQILQLVEEYLPQSNEDLCYDHLSYLNWLTQWTKLPLVQRDSKFICTAMKVLSSQIGGI